MSKLNENLRQAYSEINAINWNEVGDNIRESFSKIKAPGFPSPEQTRLFIEKVREFSRLPKNKQYFDTKRLTEEIRKELRLQDSLECKKNCVGLFKQCKNSA